MFGVHVMLVPTVVRAAQVVMPGSERVIRGEGMPIVKALTLKP